VVVGRGGAAVAADKAHHWPAFALPRVVQEVADDQAQMLQVPVQRLQILGGLQHHVPEALHLRRLARRPLRRVGPWARVAEIELQWFLAGQRRQVVGVRDDANGKPGRVGQLHAQAAHAFRQLRGGRTGRLGQSQDVGGISRPERRADEPRPALADQHARRTRVGTPQLQRVRGP
jgi:hypothetical protein